ncbi:MAG: ABC transporter ATP-binding protein, partial [Pseudomonadota bacterium]
ICERSPIALLHAVAETDDRRARRVALGDRVWFDKAAGLNTPVRRRRVGVVFQDYALFETMSVAENIGYGAPKALRESETATWISRLELTGLERRYPSQLSGGQRQRVALARALAADPELLLLDEPFSAVDAHLRGHLRSQLMGLAAAVKTPVVMVTHDLEEARQVADRVGVVAEGRVRRFGPTEEVFDDPGDYAAACVLGWRNLLKLERCEGLELSGSWGALRLGAPAPMRAGWVGIRPEHVEMGAGVAEGAGLEARVVRVREMGPVREVQLRLRDGAAFYAQRPWNAPAPAPGETVRLGLPAGRLRLLDEAGAARGHRLVGPQQRDRAATPLRTIR